MSARRLHISEKLSLPHDTSTSTLVVYGGKGMGKTVFASVLAEECSASSIRFSFIDPMGVGWGLRYDASGKGPGIEMLILGGIHGDIPIEPTAGDVVADMVADEDVSILIDISRRADGTMWTIGERVRFVTAYFKRLYGRQGEKRRPLLQIVDEAARFAPQIVRAGDTEVALCLNAIAVMMEEGRNLGVGMAVFTQRSARLNKDLAELADCMISFRIIGPRSMSAVLDWLGEYVEKDRHKEIATSLRKLPRGTAIVISPGWLEVEEIVPIRMRRTFDSSATPKSGERAPRTHGPGAKPDLARYLARMQATVEAAKANNPKELRAEVVRLKAELAKKLPPAPAPEQTIREISVIKAADRQLLNVSSARIEKTTNVLAIAAEHLVEFGRRLEVAMGTRASPAPISPRRPSPPPAPAKPRPDPRPAAAAGEAGLKPKQLAILAAVAQLEALGHPTASRKHAAVLSKQSPNSSSYEGHIGFLTREGYLEAAGGGLKLRDQGRALVPVETPATPEDLVEAYKQHVLSDYGVSLFNALLAEPDRIFSREDLAAAAGKSHNSSSFEAELADLRKLGLADYVSEGVTLGKAVR